MAILWFACPACRLMWSTKEGAYTCCGYSFEEWMCERCGSFYLTKADAEKCESEDRAAAYIRKLEVK